VRSPAQLKSSKKKVRVFHPAVKHLAVSIHLCLTQLCPMHSAFIAEWMGEHQSIKENSRA
jgi:hypothetical protein